MDASYLSDKFAAALPYDRYVQTGTDEQQRRWKQVYDAAHVSDRQRELIGGFARRMNVLVVSGIWCGDCVAQCPMFDLIARAAPKTVQLRFVDRDQHKDLSDQVRLNAGSRVPTVLFLAEDFELSGLYGDRTLARYRAIASRQLGPSCPVGIVPPGDEELAETIAEWVAEFERIQLMLRLSPRLRQKHGD